MWEHTNMLMNDEQKNNHPKLPVDGYIRAKALAPLLGISVVTLWRWSSAGKMPKPVKLGERVTVWRAEDIRVWMKNVEG